MDSGGSLLLGCRVKTLLALVHQKLSLLNVTLIQDFLALYANEVGQLGFLHLLILDLAQDLILSPCVFCAHHNRALIVVVKLLVNLLLVLPALLHNLFLQLLALAIVETSFERFLLLAHDERTSLSFLIHWHACISNRFYCQTFTLSFFSLSAGM